VYPSVNAADRLRMLELAVKGRKGFEVSGVEIRRKKVSYTIDTLNYIRHRLPTAELFLIIGADNLAQFHLWKSYKRILKLVSLAVYKRRGFNSALRSRFEYELIKGDLFRFSSTDIRKRINRKMPVQGIIPKKVLKYITDRSLYSNEEE
jgi:nicotinate-nucleotide adenylyltransferase